ncbi:MAG: bifunctional oligoribonuclease/PAP phosphatase NrnA [Planctomycetota bacterium]|jgi:phosphoesterase RecJ-like protein|nr:bifunctional oligoribonuclease/PAP phosphatase NrnA [Planctomycetota bacterium]
MALQDIVDFIMPLRGKRLAAVTHSRPDGDAAGSVWGLCGILRAIGVGADAVNLAPIPESLRFLRIPELDRIHPEPDWPDQYDALAVLDCGEWPRLDPVNQVAADKLPAMTIDHHATSAGVGGAIWIDPAASSAGEMVVRLARVAGWTIPRGAAQALWAAIVTDTGRFSYENTSVAALEAAKECVRRGADPATAAAQLYQSIGRGELVLRRRVMERIEFLRDGRLATSWLSRDDFREAGIDAGVAQGLGDILRSVEGVEAALFLYEMTGAAGEAPARVKVSVRTRTPHDATALTARFGGGGHLRAAGCALDPPLDAARKKAVAAATELWFPEPRP